MNANSVKLQVRMERSLKEEVEEIFAEMGLDTTTAVRMFFTKVARTRSIPFLLKAEPEFTPEQETRILEAWEQRTKSLEKWDTRCMVPSPWPTDCQRRNRFATRATCSFLEWVWTANCA